jgi:hypothetical protein
MSPGMLGAPRARILGWMDEERAQQKKAPEAQETSGEDCEICGSEMYGLHCKLVCPNCGYRRDCSDP